MKTLLLFIALSLSIPCFAALPDGEISTTKQERNYIREGNRQFAQKNYTEAEVAYRKALEVAPGSPFAQFNLATALLMQAGNQPAAQDKKQKNDPIQQAASLLTNLAKNAPTRDLRSKANYDLGNLAFAGEQYQQAVELYKQALRENPDDDQARYNLRLAQLKLRDQQNNQNQNQDKNKDQNKDQNKDNQDKNKNQDKQDQNQDKQDQNQDKNQDKNQDQNQDSNNNDKSQQQQQQGQMSQQNAEQVLKAMQNQENATKQKVERIQAQEKQRERNRTNRKW